MDTLEEYMANNRMDGLIGDAERVATKGVAVEVVSAKGVAMVVICCSDTIIEYYVIWIRFVNR